MIPSQVRSWGGLYRSHKTPLPTPPPPPPLPWPLMASSSTDLETFPDDWLRVVLADLHVLLALVRGIQRGHEDGRAPPRGLQVDLGDIPALVALAALGHTGFEALSGRHQDGRAAVVMEGQSDRCCYSRMTRSHDTVHFRRASAGSRILTCRRGVPCTEGNSSKRHISSSRRKAMAGTAYRHQRRKAVRMGGDGGGGLARSMREGSGRRKEAGKRRARRG